MVYEEFELLATDVQTVQKEEERWITFRLQVPRSPAGEHIEGVPSGYDRRDMRQRLRGWERRTLDWPEVIQLGAWLGETLFPAEVRDLLVRSLERVQAQGKGLRIRLLLEGALHNLPWEYALLNRGGGEATVTDFLALMPDVSIVRHQAATLPAWEVEAELPARMVVALANPAGYPFLDLAKERQAIQQAIEGTPDGKAPLVEATFVADATVDNLLAGVKRAHLFHFAGHGDFPRDMGVEPGTVEGQGLIVLDDGAGDPRPLDAGQLALQLRQAGVRVAVLGACESGRRDDVNAWSSVAAALLKGGLGAVVGMQYPIRDDSAIAFARPFYTALVSGLPIDEALSAGRLAIARDDVRGWGVPVLYMRAPDGVIFAEHAAAPALESTRAGIRVSADLRITELRGKAVAVDIGKMVQGAVEARMVIDRIARGGEAIGVRIDTLDGGSVKSDQTVDRVDGTVTGVVIDNLG